MKKTGYNAHGFTLMEMVVAITVLGIVGAIAFKILTNQVTAFNDVFSNTVAVADLRKVIRGIRRDLRNLDRSAVDEMSASELTFKKNDGTDVHYLYEAGHFMKNDSVIIGNILSEPFTYLNVEKDETNSADSLSFVQVSLVVEAANGDTVSITESIYARN
ncbi:MAG: type II secretion system protein [Calditrichaeota bacterium]|nr:MAG: type II secretion system protein [Calditrichota bacterium]